MSGPEWAAHRLELGIAAGELDMHCLILRILHSVEYRLSAYEDSPGAISPEDWLFQTW